MVTKNTHPHEHTHEHPNKKNVINRLARIIGHLEGIKRMVENDVDCSDILIQLSAVRSALNNTGKIILSDHINHCLLHAYEENDTEIIEKLNDAIGKFLK
ncbi:MAG: metal-sensing transcriptional repressor [Peptococcaceae bacterium]|nr:metal-sensing transcriptional repressor [Peptococcaceae bacterium]